MSGYSPDPIEIAKRDVARSKEIVASVRDDLNEHRRWLESYAAEEAKSRRQHTRRMKRQHAALRRQERRQRSIRRLRRTGLSLALGGRATIQLLTNTALSIGRTTRALAVATAGLGVGVASSIGARARTAKLAGVAASATGAIWVRRGAGRLAVVTRDRTLRGRSWIVAKSRSSKEAGLAAGTAGAVWSRRKAHVLSSSARMRLRTAFVWSRAALRRAAADGSAWLAAGASHVRLTSHRTALIVSSRARVATRQLTTGLLARIFATRPLLQKYRSHTADLAAGISGHAGHWLGRASQMLRASQLWRMLGAARARSLRFETWSRGPDLPAPDPAAAPEPEAELQAGLAKDFANFHQRDATPRRRTAIACVEPWRCKLPALPMKQPGRALLPLN